MVKFFHIRQSLVVSVTIYQLNAHSIFRLADCPDWVLSTNQAITWLQNIFFKRALIQVTHYLGSMDKQETFPFTSMHINFIRCHNDQNT